jgi:hypothetical protein
MVWMRVGVVVMALSAAVVLQSGPARAQASPFIGQWHLNTSLSKAAPGETPPSDLVTQIDRMDTAHVHWTTTSTDGQGQKDVETFDTPGNGEFYSLDGSTMVSHKLSPSTVQSTYRDASGQTDVLTCTLSGNARQMTCNGVITHQDNSVVHYTDVFDRM